MTPTARTLLVLALAAAAAAPAAAAGTSSAPGCKRSGSKTVVETRSARAYAVPRYDGSFLFACLKSLGRPRLLAREFDDDYVMSATYGHVRLAGRFAAWSLTRTDISCKDRCPPEYEPTRTRLRIADLRSGRWRGVDGEVEGDALVLAARGAIAWVQALPVGGFEVRALDARGARVLDSGAVDPASLALRGAVVSWTRDGRRSSAELE